MKTDITDYSDQELSLLVFNTEHLYLARRNVVELSVMLDEEFLFTEEQCKVLTTDLLDDKEDY